MGTRSANEDSTQKEEKEEEKEEEEVSSRRRRRRSFERANERRHAKPANEALCRHRGCEIGCYCSHGDQHGRLVGRDRCVRRGGFKLLGVRLGMLLLPTAGICTTRR
ncbi:unnamed protein product [Prorocentrum cordatum]|uniref:Uncharacterized protein n=1 Tax=Prorocentrum cordatum TaxID=2364126 RepID=A0ABN9WUF3_9DINO|nr:unnamed protein product [Polarella glacialis]